MHKTQMDATDVFSAKAEKYAKYRWGYAPQSIQTIFETTRIGKQSCVADIGAGTGILTRVFVGRVEQIFAVEPNPEMRAIAETRSFPFFWSTARGRAFGSAPQLIRVVPQPSGLVMGLRVTPDSFGATALRKR